MLTVKDIQDIARMAAIEEANRVKEEIIKLLQAEDACKKAEEAWAEAVAARRSLDTERASRRMWEGWDRKAEELNFRIHQEKQKEHAAR
jgi:hypothetical protein